MRAFLVSVVCVWLAAGLNMGVAGKIAILGGNPDFLLIVLSTLGLFLSRSGSALLGFFSGLVYGSLAGANLAQYVISRTVAGFVTGWLNDVGFQGSVLLAGLSALIITLLAQLLLMFTAPPAQITPFLGDTIRMAMYNGVLAMPFYALLSRILEPQSR